MEPPRLDELKPGKLIGHGGSGRVFQAKDEHGGDCAVKVFERTGISRELLEAASSRLEIGGWPAAVMPVRAASFAAEPACWVTPLIATLGNAGEVVPRNLQTRLDEHPGTQSWPLVKSLARALARMHERRVVHANLKPGNVFFADNGDLLLADWAMGNLPGVAQFKFTDAVLYQPPEQLRSPAGYTTEAAFRWDVFAFGVLAFRILTGRFPRCHDTFKSVAPLPGAGRREIQADLGKIADNLESQRNFTWPDGAHNALEAGFREWINRCLPLDPGARPATMMEVADGFDGLEKKATSFAERAALRDHCRHAEHRAWRALFFGNAAAVSAVAIGVLWYLSHQKLDQQRNDQMLEMLALKATAEREIQATKNVEQAFAQAQAAWEAERGFSLTRLEASRQMGDHLFSWAMEKGHRNLPPLDGREVRLNRLQRYFQDFLSKSAGVEALSGERARAKLQLAEIAIAAGDTAAASKQLAEALGEWRDQAMDATMKLRVATDWLLLALLRQTSGDPDAGASFVAARKALENVPQTEVDADRLNQLLAILDFREAQLLSSRGDDRQALDQLMRATETLNRIADQRPDVAILRSELAACYLSSATVLEGMGSLGDAREVRSLASAELVKLLKSQPADFNLRLQLAGCYGAMAESAVLAGDVSGAENLSDAALQLLDRLVVEQPDHAEAVSRKASQLGLRAGIQRDRGLTTDAITGYDEGIRMLDALHASAPENGLVSYRLAQLWWQKGRMLGMGGDRNKEVILISDARELLNELVAKPPGDGPRLEQLRSSLAYLLGDLGHALQLAGRKDDSRKVFGDAVELWQALLTARPQSEEYGESLAWCRQRAADLK
jgi:hypothetical protein